MENELASECLLPNIDIGFSSKMWGHSQTLPLYHTYLVNGYYSLRDTCGQNSLSLDAKMHH